MVSTYYFNGKPHPPLLRPTTLDIHSQLLQNNCIQTHTATNYHHIHHGLPWYLYTMSTIKPQPPHLRLTVLNIPNPPSPQSNCQTQPTNAKQLHSDAYSYQLPPYTPRFTVVYIYNFCGKPHIPLLRATISTIPKLLSTIQF